MSTTTTEDIQSVIRQVLLDMRTEAGLTQAELGGRMGRTGGIISQAENTEGINSITKMRDYESALGVPYGSILLRAGLIEYHDGPNVVAAIKAASELSPDAKNFLLKAYALSASTSAGA